MYQNPIVLGTTVAGIAVLPNTGGNEVLMIASIATIAIGAIVMLTTIARRLAKKSYRI